MYYKQSFTQIKLAPFIRYYLLCKNQKLNLLAEGSYYKGWAKNKNLGGFSRGKPFGYSFAAGHVWFINPHTALELTLNYA